MDFSVAVALPTAAEETLLGTEDDATIDHDSAEVTNTHLHVIRLAKMINVYFLFPAVSSVTMHTGPLQHWSWSFLETRLQGISCVIQFGARRSYTLAESLETGFVLFFKQRALNVEKYLKKESFELIKETQTNKKEQESPLIAASISRWKLFGSRRTVEGVYHRNRTCSWSNRTAAHVNATGTFYPIELVLCVPWNFFFLRLALIPKTHSTW